jgi:hypothetical protein
LHALRRRFAIFVPAIAVALLVQALVAVVARVNHGTEVGEAVVLPVLTTLTYAFVAADARGVPLDARSIWERFLERAWAVIVIDFFLTIVSGIGLTASIAQNPLDVAVGTAVFVFCALLVFSDASATIDDDATVWSVIPRSIANSVRTAWNRRTFVRALAIFSLQLVAFAVQIGLSAWFVQAHVRDGDFWSQVPLLTIVTPPLAALTALVYVDAVGLRAESRERG